jgi:hypothetical protein
MASELMSPSNLWFLSAASIQFLMFRLVHQFPAKRTRIDADQTVRNIKYKRRMQCRVQRSKQPEQANALRSSVAVRVSTIGAFPDLIVNNKSKNRPVRRCPLWMAPALQGLN